MTRIVIAFALFAAACGGKKDDSSSGGGDTKAEGSAKAGSAKSGSATGSAAKAGGGSAEGSGASGDDAPKTADIPTEVDFEDEAARRITEKTLATEVQNLEKEIAETGANAP
jgi:hypothetical protein